MYIVRFPPSRSILVACILDLNCLICRDGVPLYSGIYSGTEMFQKGTNANATEPPPPVINTALSTSFRFTFKEETFLSTECQSSEQF